MPGENVIPFPAGHRSGFQRGHAHRRRLTVRFLGPPPSLPLPLPAGSTLDQRIAAAKATIANYDALASLSRPVSASIYEGFGRQWSARLDALLAEKAALVAAGGLR